MEVAGVVPAASGAGAVEMQATVDTESEAVQFSMGGMAGLPGGAASLNVIIIGNDAWVDPGTGTYIAQPGGASTYGPVLQQLSPENLLQRVPAGGMAGAQRVGEEDRNGVPTIHYLAEGSSSPEMAAELGPDSVVHLWVATDGGHMVALEMQGTTEVQGVDTDIVMSMDISRINDPTIEIRPPG
jgi:hypothetical protein